MAERCGSRLCVVFCEELKVIQRMPGDALWYEAEDMAVSPADVSFHLMLFLSQGLCLWQHWTRGMVAAGPVLPAQRNGLSWLPQIDICRGAWKLFSHVLEAVPDFSHPGAGVEPSEELFRCAPTPMCN